MISTSASTVIGFSLTGSTIDSNGSVGCMDESACNYDPDATIPGGCQYEVDCLGICGGLAEEDECGVCNGPGTEIECWDGELVCNAENCSDEPVFTDVDYLTEIQPIFNANCTYYCHTNGGPYQGGLDLTSYDNLMLGTSDHGPVVTPGDSENSILIQKLGDEPPFGNQMPQNGPPYLDAYTIALIAAWIDEGALPSEGGMCNGLGAEIECWDGELVCDVENCTDEPVFTNVDYATEIQPIFIANCTYYCHTNGGPYQGGLDLTSYENLMAGDSEHGPVVMPGDSENSILIQKLGDEPPFGVQMPQSGPPYLDAYTIALIAAWIDEGALPSEGGSDDGGNEVVEGCMDPNANNYDPYATDDDGSCTYDPLGELTFGSIDYDNGTLEINLDCQYAVSSFVF